MPTRRGATVSDPQKKRMSVQIDETIEGFLKFLFRYLQTFPQVLLSTFRPELLLKESAADPPKIVKPLTYLSLGAFAFALMMEAYPSGLSGMIDLIWVTDDIRGTVRDGWKEAISITTLVTKGFPILVTVGAAGGVFGRLLFRDAIDQQRWRHLTCYAFGFQTALLFLLFSLSICRRTR